MLGFVHLQVEAQPTVTFHIVETSDVHGAFFPYNFTERKGASGSMARVSTLLKRLRSKYGKRVIVVDNGDILQGQPGNYYSNFVRTDRPNIASAVINYLRYDAANLGNHDLETGHAVYDKWISEMECPVLGANVIDTKSGKPYTEPYVIIERAGVRIAILGMMTPAIPNWMHPQLWSGMRFEEIVDCTRRWVKTLREKEQADVVVGLFHSGLEGGIVTDEYDEDAVRKIAERIKGIDVILYGHDHREFNGTIGSTLCLNPAANAMKVAVATVKVRDGKVVAKHGELIDVGKEAVDSDYMVHLKEYQDSIQGYVNRQIGTFLRPMASRDAFFGSAPFVDFIHQMQLSHTGADISFAAPLSFNTEISAGPVYMSDMFKLYRFENHIYTLRMTGREIHDFLEMSYSLWVNTMMSPDDHIMQLAPKVAGDNQREGFLNFLFNFDSAAGLDYEVDVTAPKGKKVRIMGFTDGRMFDETAWYSVAMSSYRGSGGGELLVRGAGIDKDSLTSRITYMSPRDQRYYLIQYIEREREVTSCSLNNWRFVPESWALPAIQRDKELLFGIKP